MTHDPHARRESPEIMLDGNPVALNDPRTSLREVFQYLESLALRHDRVLSSVLVDGVRMRPNEARLAPGGFHSLKADSVTFDELGKQMVRAVRTRVRELQERVKGMQFLVLINNWDVAQWLWWELVPDFKTPMIELSFLQELWGSRLSELKLHHRTLVQHWDLIGSIHAEIEMVLQRQESLTILSDLLERKLGPWLQRLADYLDHLDAEKSN